MENVDSLSVKQAIGSLRDGTKDEGNDLEPIKDIKLPVVPRLALGTTQVVQGVSQTE